MYSEAFLLDWPNPMISALDVDNGASAGASSSSSASTPHPPLPATSQPPRKRQRTEERELGDAGDFEKEGDGQGAGAVPGPSSLSPSHSQLQALSISSGCTCSCGGGKIDMHTTDEEAQRDEEYYLDGADCVIRIENTLFRVHKFMLARDSSAFQDMFTLPSGDSMSGDVEGSSDSNPIRLYGESPHQFRALLSVLYALPPEIHKFNTASADVDALLAIASITNKYHFSTLETWAIEALYSVTSGLHGAPLHDLTTFPSARMAQILEVAYLCGHTRLREFVVEAWTERILKRDLKPAPALAIADRYGLRGLLGVAYYVQLMEMGENFEVEDDAEDDEQLEPVEERRKLDPAQKMRLLSGHWSLTQLWERLRTSAPKFARPDGCTYHQHGCLSTWTTVWGDVGKSEVTLRYKTADVVGRLRSMEEQLCLSTDLQCALTPQCKRRALLALKATIREVQDGLADYFVNLAGEMR